jgi:hypothetical protein
MSRVLEFKGATERISLPDLRRSVPYTLSNGNLPRARPVEHHQLWDRITELCKANGVPNVYTEDVAVHSGQTMRISWPHKDQPIPVENLLIQRVHGIIRLGEDIVYEGETMCPAIAIVYMEDSITIGFGINVRICDNLNIYGANVVSTKDTDFENVMEVVEAWIKNLGPKWKQHIDIFKRAKGIAIDNDEIFRLYGKLISKAVDMNEGRGAKTCLNVTQVVATIRRLNLKFEGDREINLWDLLQSGTEVLKPEKASFATILKVSQAFGNFLLTEFGIKDMTKEQEDSTEVSDPVFNEAVTEQFND